MTDNSPHVSKLPKVEITLGRMEWIVQRCKGKKVLHLGCVDEGFTRERFERRALMHTKLLEACRGVWGVDASTDGLKFLKAMGVNNLIQADIERIWEREDLKGQDFDIILASEVVEHLNNPGLFLQGVKCLFSANTKMIITVPNCFRLTGLSQNLKGCESVHPDHNYWFSYKTLVTLLNKNGYIVEEILVYSYLNYKIPSLRNLIDKMRSKIQRRQSMQARDKLERSRRRGNPVARVISVTNLVGAILFRRVLYNCNPFLADGIIAVVRPKDYY